MFGGFGGFGGQDPNQQQPTGGMPGMPGMSMNVTTTQQTTTSSSGPAPGAGGQGDPGKKSQEMQDRFKHREAKLPTYIALVDVLEIKGEDVTAMRDAASKAKMTPEELAKGQEVFAKITQAVMSFDFSKIMQYDGELYELQQIDDEKERQFKKLEALLKSFDKYEEIRQEFGIVTTTTTTHQTSAPVGASVHITGAPIVGTTVPAGGLELRVAQLETNYAVLKAEFEAFKAQQAAQNQAFDTLIKTLQGVPVATTTYAQVPAPAPVATTTTYAQPPAPAGMPVPPPTQMSASVDGMKVEMKLE